MAGSLRQYVDFFEMIFGDSTCANKTAPAHSFVPGLSTPVCLLGK